MIKKIFAIFIMANLVLNVNSAICSSIGYFTVSVVGSDIDIIPIPVNRAPARKGKIVCAVYNSDDEGKTALIERIEKLYGPHVIECSEQLGTGKADYELIHVK